MHLVSRALAWVRAVLSGLPEPDDRHLPFRTCVGSVPEPSLTAQGPSPEMWAAFLASARRRRGSHPRPHTELPAITANDISSTLVGAYLLTPEVRQHIRHSRQFMEAS